MAGITRRSTISGAVILLFGSAGCLSEQSRRSATSTEETDGSTSEVSTITTDTSLPEGIYFSEILPNPEGDDSRDLNKEYVLVEMHEEGPYDLSGFVVEYGDQYSYTFPELVSELETHSSLKIHTGSGNERKESSGYHLYVSNDEPLLDNEKMELTLRNQEGKVIDQVKYSDLEPGQTWVQLE